MKFAKLVGFPVALAGTAVLGGALFFLAAVGRDIASAGIPSGWNGWGDALFFLLMLAVAAAAGGGLLWWGVWMAHAGTPEAESTASNLFAMAALATVIVAVTWAMRSSLDRLRWACAGLLGLLWFACAASNAAIARLEFSGADRRGQPSAVMLVGGLIGLAAVHAIPHQWDSIKWALRLGVVLLDYGSVPLLLIGVWVIGREALRRSKSGRFE